MNLDLVKSSERNGKQLEITFSSRLLSYTITSNVLGKLIWDILNPMIQDVQKGYISYSGVTQLCNSFKGKPDDATIGGRVVDTNANDVSSGSEIKFDFISTPQSDIGGSNLRNTETCDDKDDVINKNLLDILTYHGRDALNLTIRSMGTGDNQIGKEDLERLKKTIGDNEMYTTPEQTKEVNLYAKITVIGTDGKTIATAPLNIVVQTKNAQALSGISSPEIQNKVQDEINTGNPTNVRNAAYVLLSSAQSELSSIGNTKDAEAVSKASSAVCKMMGMRNWQGKGDIGRSLAALCGIASIFNKESSGNICSLAGIYSAINAAVKSGNPEAAVYAVAGALEQAGFKIDKRLLATAAFADMIRGGDMESVLKAAAAAVLSSDREAAKYLGLLANVAQSVKSGGDVEAAVMAAMAMLGDQEMFKYFASMKNLESAIKGGDARAIIDAAGNVAKQFGFSGLSQFSSMLAEGESVVNLLGNLDELFNACSAFKWDWICLNPTVASGVCQQPGAAPPGCVLNPSGIQAFPPLTVQKLCNDLVFDLGFQIDCTCVYVCTAGATTYPFINQVSVGVDLKQIMAMLNPEQYAGLFREGGVGMMNYCMLDP
jgi:hypothetical protein